MRFVGVVLLVLVLFASAYPVRALDMRFPQVIGEIDAFYEELSVLTGQGYETPKLFLLDVGEVYMQPECGRAVGGTGFGAFYCPPAQTIVMDMPFVNDYFPEDNDYVPALVLAHEWAHHVQRSVGLERSLIADSERDWDVVWPIEAELGADCQAGVFFAHMEAIGVTDSGDLADAVVAMSEVGDSPFTPRSSGQSHGSGRERANAFLRGYRTGFVGCVQVDPRVPFTSESPLLAGAN